MGIRISRFQLVGLLCCSAAVAACSCGEEPQTEGLAAKAEPGPDAVPDPDFPDAGQYLVDFGPVSVGKEAMRTFEVLNKGATDMNVSALDLAGVWTSDLAADTSVAVNGSLAIAFTFRPETEGDQEQVVTIGTTGGDLKLRLKGNGVIARFDCSPLQLDFGSVVKTTSKQGSLECRNLSQLDGVLTVGDIQGDAADLFSYSIQRDENGQVLVRANGGIEIVVTFRANREGEASAFFSLEQEDGSRVGLARLRANTVRSALQLDPDVTCPGIDFGFAAPSSTVQKVLTLRNLGAEPLTITELVLDVTSDPEFTLSTAAPFQIPPDLAETPEPENQLPVTLGFSPTALGRRQGTLVLRSNDPNSPEVRVCLAGFGGGPTVACSPAAIDFGQVAMGVPVTRPFVCTNAGTDDATTTEDNLVVQAPTTTNGEFTAQIRDLAGVDPEGDGFQVGQTFTVDVVYAPAGEGVDNAEVILATNDTAMPEVHTPVTGNGRNLPPCVYQLVPPQLRFGIVDRGHTATLEFGIKNVLDTECLVTDLHLSADTDPAFTLANGAIQDASIAGNGELRIPVTFAPADYAPLFQGTVEFTISDPANPYREVELRGTSAQPCALIAPDDLDFGTVAPGCSTRDREVQIINVCSQPVCVSAIEMNEGASTEFFVRTRPTFPACIAPGLSATFTMAYRPEDEGEDLGSVFITSDQSTEPYMATMRGRGAFNATQTDTFSQDDRPQVDLLWVIDNSGSMSEEQAGVATNLNAFLSFAVAQQIDFQIGVTTTGLTRSWSSCPGGVDGGEDGRLFPVDGSSPRILTPSTPDLEATYATNINVGLCHGDELGLEAAYRALTPPAIDNADDPRYPEPNDGNLGFLRRDAHLSILFLSDEEDQSPQTTNFYYNFFLSLKGFRNSNLFSAHAIVGDPATGCNSGNGNASAGDRYIDVATRSGGIFQSICSQDWTSALEEIGTAAFGFKTRFFLTNQPEDTNNNGIISDSEGEMEVRLNGRPYPSVGTRGDRRWEYDGSVNSIDFFPLAVPEPGSQIEVSYRVACL